MRSTHAQLSRHVILAAGLVVVVLAVAWGVRALPQAFGRESCQATVDGTTFTLAPDQMANVATIAAISVRRGLPARAATIALATARQESKFRNLDYGDRDSLGLFQQRPSQGWGTQAQVQDPVYATNRFYDALVKVKGYPSMEITKVAQRVQRSGFPEAYAAHEAEARVLASAVTGHSSAALTCRLDPSGPPGGRAAVAAFQAAAAKEQVPVTATPLASTTGTRMQVRDRRISWSLAQWAVGSAQRLGVSRVYVDGQVWRRAAPDQGWAATSDGGSGVVVTFTDDAPR